MTSLDYAVDSKIWGFLSGGLNMQASLAPPASLRITLRITLRIPLRIQEYLTGTEHPDYPREHL